MPPRAFVDRDIGEVVHVESADGPDREDGQTNQRHPGDDEHRPQCLTGSTEMDTDKDCVNRQVDPPPIGEAGQVQRFDIASDEGRDGGRSDGILNENRRPRGESTPRAQRPPREGVAPPAVGNADDISAILSTIDRYIAAMMTAAMARPPNPPLLRPVFQPA